MTSGADQPPAAEEAVSEVARPSKGRRAAFQKWLPYPGDTVEIHESGAVVRSGVVETVMPNGSGFWLAAEGLETRTYIHTWSDGLDFWVTPAE